MRAIFCAGDRMNLSVLVPTYRRPDDLRRCAHALARQQRPADEVIIVHRADDAATVALLPDLAASVPGLRAIAVERPGQVHALNRGLDAVTGEIVAVTDDDAAPHPDWLSRIAAAFADDPSLSGIGGRDLIDGRDADEQVLRPTVGRVQWFGRVIGNHHVGRGPPRPVHVLKCVNSAYRADLLKAIRYDETLKGGGAQVHAELALGLCILARRGTLRYDPALRVDHFPAPRFDADQRGQFNARALSDEIHNETLALLRYFPPARRAALIGWSLAIGTRAYPGALIALYEGLRGRPQIGQRLAASARGRIEGVRSWWST
jgi:glycosyltransferase involved in cell wall biosynthesis